MLLSSEEETFAFGEELGRRLKPGSLLFFRGDLGAGKTTMIKGVAKGLLGLSPDLMHSPTFTYMQIYKGEGKALHHFDLYRLKDAEEFLHMGLDEFFGQEVISCVEWPERIDSLQFRPSHEILLSHTRKGRKVRIHEV